MHHTSSINSISNQRRFEFPQYLFLRLPLRLEFPQSQFRQVYHEHLILQFLVLQHYAIFDINFEFILFIIIKIIPNTTSYHDYIGTNGTIR